MKDLLARVGYLAPQRNRVDADAPYKSPFPLRPLCLFTGTLLLSPAAIVLLAKKSDRTISRLDFTRPGEPAI